MADTKLIQQIRQGELLEYFGTLRSPSAGDKLLMALEGDGVIENIVVQGVDDADVNIRLHLVYPASQLYTVLTNSATIDATNNINYNLNTGESHGTNWYRYPSGSLLRLEVNSVTTANDLQLLALIH